MSNIKNLRRSIKDYLNRDSTGLLIFLISAGMMAVSSVLSSGLGRPLVILGLLGMLLFVFYYGNGYNKHYD